MYTYINTLDLIVLQLILVIKRIHPTDILEPIAYKYTLIIQYSQYSYLLSVVFTNTELSILSELLTRLFENVLVLPVLFSKAHWSLEILWSGILVHSVFMQRASEVLYMNSSVNVSFYVLTLVFAVPTFFTGFVVQSHVQWAAGAVATFVACLNLMLLFLRYSYSATSP